MTTINPPSEDIKDMLENSSTGLGLVAGTNLFLSIQPTAPNNVVTVIDSGGMYQLRYGMERPNLQILVRNNVYLTGYNLIKDIKYFLHEKNNEVWNSTRYISIIARSEIGLLGIDPKNRFEWSLNFQIHRTA